ncbi:MAG: hypothetical protein ACM359_13535 [Bacillota bacterium]
MSAKRKKSEKKATEEQSGKVGSSKEAAKEFGGTQDFGQEPEKAPPALPEGTDSNELPLRPSRYQGTRGGSTGTRTTGVGAPEGGPGSGSGGDVDPDVIGVGGTGGLAASGDLGPTTDASQTTGKSDEFASGGPAKGENQGPRQTPGTSVGDVTPRGTGAAENAPEAEGIYTAHEPDDEAARREKIAREEAEKQHKLETGEA